MPGMYPRYDGDRRPKVLFVGATLNQITMMHKISRYMRSCDCYFSPMYHASPILSVAGKLGVTRSSVIGKRVQGDVRRYIEANRLAFDFKARKHAYDLAVVATDIVNLPGLAGVKKVLVQEGLVLPGIAIRYHLAKHTPLPLWVGGGYAAGISHNYEAFCVASQGTFDHFVKHGLNPKKLCVTGTPNFDRLREEAAAKPPFTDLKNYVLVATRPHRDDLEIEQRGRLFKRARRLAEGRPVVVKLHPREHPERASRRVKRILPGAHIYARGDIVPMIANCDIFLTTRSTTAWNAIAMGKPVYCNQDIDLLRRLLPEQNGRAAQNIAEVCRAVLAVPVWVEQGAVVRAAAN